METHVLLGAENVERAGHNIQHAADEMTRAADNIAEAVRQFNQNSFDDWLRRIEEILHPLQEIKTRQFTPEEMEEFLAKWKGTADLIARVPEPMPPTDRFWADGSRGPLSRGEAIRSAMEGVPSGVIIVQEPKAREMVPNPIEGLQIQTQSRPGDPEGSRRMYEMVGDMIRADEAAIIQAIKDQAIAEWRAKPENQPGCWPLLLQQAEDRAETAKLAIERLERNAKTDLDMAHARADAAEASLKVLVPEADFHRQQLAEFREHLKIGPMASIAGAILAMVANVKALKTDLAITVGGRQAAVEEVGNLEAQLEAKHKLLDDAIQEISRLQTLAGTLQTDLTVTQAEASALGMRLAGAVSERDRLRRHEQEWFDAFKGIPAEGPDDLGHRFRKMSIRLEAIDAARSGEPPMPSTEIRDWPSIASARADWGRLGWDAAAAMRVERDEAREKIKSAMDAGANVLAEEDDAMIREEQERIITALAAAPNPTFAEMGFTLSATWMRKVIGSK
jgi:hypothetical protein